MTVTDPAADRAIREVLASRGLSDVSPVGSGGMGSVYRAWHETLSRWVAVKVTDPQVAHNPDNRRRFQTEMRLLAKIRHPAVVTVYDGNVGEGMAYFLMDFIPGVNLDQLIRQRASVRRPFTLDEVVHYLRPMAGALDYLHRMTPPIIHRDIKPANILVPSDHTAAQASVLTDFGISIAGGDTRVTSLGVVVGSEQYMAPERFWGDSGAQPDGGASGDNYALALIAWEMLTLTSLFDTMPQRSWRRGPRDTGIRADLVAAPLRPRSHELTALFRVLLADNPESRPRTAADVVDGLEQVARRTDTGTAPTRWTSSTSGGRTYDWQAYSPTPVPDRSRSAQPVPTPVRSHRGVIRMLAVVTVVALVIAGAILGVALSRDGSGSWSSAEQELQQTFPGIIPEKPGENGGAGTCRSSNGLGDGQEAQIVCGDTSSTLLTLAVYRSHDARNARTGDIEPESGFRSGPDGIDMKDPRGCQVSVYRAEAEGGEAAWLVFPDPDDGRGEVTVTGDHVSGESVKELGQYNYCPSM